MLAIVRLALAKPYTFVVLRSLILIMGPLAALKTPDGHFPGHQDSRDRPWCGPIAACRRRTCPGG